MRFLCLFKRKSCCRGLTDSLSVLLRRLAGLLFEQAAEILRVLEAEGVGNLVDGEVGGDEPRLGEADDVLLDVGLGAGAGVGLHHVAEVVGREVHFVGKLAYRGQAALAGFAAVEVAAQEGVELCDEFLAGGLAAGKLAGVVAAAVAKE